MTLKHESLINLNVKHTKVMLSLLQIYATHRQYKQENGKGRLVGRGI